MDDRTKLRGFASMTKEKQRESAAKGGKSVAIGDRTFSKDRELASTAGRKGGFQTKNENRAFSRDRELAVSAGRKGGRAKRFRQPIAAIKEEKDKDIAILRSALAANRSNED